MKNLNPKRAEFYEAAISIGYYGREESGLSGRKDYVRKFWEDIVIKMVCRPYIENVYKESKQFRILDLGSAGGDGFELLTHVPPPTSRGGVGSEFLLKPEEVEQYTGIDINKKDLKLGKRKYPGKKNIKFEYGNLENGLPETVLHADPYDVYLSTYGSLSFLEPDQLENLLVQIFNHSHSGSILIFDVHGKFCPAWPKYWAEKSTMLPYSFSYLNSNGKKNHNSQGWIDLAFWSVQDLQDRLLNSAQKAGVKLENITFTDRSIFVGRLMDSGILSNKPMPYRYQVNCLLDHDERGDVRHLKIDLDHLEEFKQVNLAVWDRLTDYQRQWNRIIILLEALMHRDDVRVKNFLENTDIELMSDELKFLTWLFRNADRFPVVDFWASVIDPQIAIILRNIEMSYSDAVGCGHSLICAMEIVK
jgi:hypothetical protein